MWTVVFSCVSVYACVAVYNFKRVPVYACVHGCIPCHLDLSLPGLHPAHHLEYIWAERGSQLQEVPYIGAGLDLTPSLSPGGHVCPVGALLQLMPQRGHPSQEGPWAPAYRLMAHEPELEAGGLLDLSFLTEEEQEAIAEVLKRDAHLRQLEEGRVR